MFLFGHLGIGSRLVDFRRRKFAWIPLFLGALFPDLVDKVLYYGLVAVTGKRGRELGLISGTRTFGHSLIFLLLVTGALVGATRRSRGRPSQSADQDLLRLGEGQRLKSVTRAFALGWASHLILDFAGDVFMTAQKGISMQSWIEGGWSSTLLATLWPVLGSHFYEIPYANAAEHLHSIWNPWIMGGEIVGLGLLLAEYIEHRRHRQ